MYQQKIFKMKLIRNKKTENEQNINDLWASKVVTEVLEEDRKEKTEEILKILLKSEFDENYKPHRFKKLNKPQV